jgi:hypothetical protein
VDGRRVRCSGYINIRLQHHPAEEGPGRIELVKEALDGCRVGGDRRGHYMDVNGYPSAEGCIPAYYSAFGHMQGCALKALAAAAMATGGLTLEDLTPLLDPKRLAARAW